MKTKSGLAFKILTPGKGTEHSCPACGKGHMFGKYLKVAESCDVCGEELHHHRADDAPPYFTILIVGHFIVAGVMMVEEYFHPDYWIHILMWFPLTIGLSLWLLPRIKGAQYLFSFDGGRRPISMGSKIKRDLDRRMLSMPDRDLDVAKVKKTLDIILKYNELGVPRIQGVKRVSKPGRRVYASVDKIPRINNGLGVAIVSTPKGVMADHDARDANVGGEIICTVF